MQLTLDRRSFIRSSICTGCLVALGNPELGEKPAWSAEQLKETKQVSDHEALHYEHLEDKVVKCHLCPKECRVADGERGYCGVRENQDGTYRTLVYGRPCTLHVDPIEKKPLFHYLPGTSAFSLATAGCNFECKFCQNWDISQYRPEQVRMIDLPPRDTARMAQATQCPTIAYTYSEPVIYYEYMLDTAIAGKELKINSVMISNGYIQEKPLRELIPHLSAIKVDFKGFTEKFYKETCNGELKPVLRSLEIIKEMGLWMELVILIIPTLNDSDSENSEMAKWIVEHLGPDVPIHLTRYHPMYKIKTIPPTPVATLERLRKIMMDAGNHFVYIGNVQGHPAENMVCYKCNEMLIRRLGFQISMEGLQNGKCKKCGTPIPGVWKDPLKA